jgi:hypothetical protein
MRTIGASVSGMFTAMPRERLLARLMLARTRKAALIAPGSLMPQNGERSRVSGSMRSRAAMLCHQSERRRTAGCCC